jgi:hypothetical protein
MRIVSYATLSVLIAGPAMAAGKSPFSAEFYSLKNTDFVVLIAFLLFIGVLMYLKVPAKLGGLLDKRAEGIQAELDEARKLREEAQSVLASYERKAREVTRPSRSSNMPRRKPGRRRTRPRSTSRTPLRVACRPQRTGSPRPKRAPCATSRTAPPRWP